MDSILNQSRKILYDQAYQASWQSAEEGYVGALILRLVTRQEDLADLLDANLHD